jgi:hypothetical protein
MLIVSETDVHCRVSSDPLHSIQMGQIRGLAYLPTFPLTEQFWLHEILWYQLLTCSINIVFYSFSYFVLDFIISKSFSVFFLWWFFFFANNFVVLFSSGFYHIELIFVYQYQSGSSNHSRCNSDCLLQCSSVSVFSVEIGCLILGTSRLIVYLAQIG